MWGYGRLSTEVYNLDKPIGHSYGEVEFYRDQLASCSGRILEPAVGSGRILIPLVQAGHVVDGTDTSPSMLESCRTNCKTYGIDAVLIEADMSTYVNEKAYEAVIVPTGSLMLLDGLEATLDALVSFHRCLNPAAGSSWTLPLQS